MDDHETAEEQGECTLCIRAGGLLLLALGGALAWMGADLVTGGALTRMVLGGAFGGAAVAGSVAGSDNEGEEVTPGDDPS